METLHVYITLTPSHYNYAPRKKRKIIQGLYFDIFCDQASMTGIWDNKVPGGKPRHKCDYRKKTNRLRIEEIGKQANWENISFYTYFPIGKKNCVAQVSYKTMTNISTGFFCKSGINLGNHYIRNIPEWDT